MIHVYTDGSANAKASSPYYRLGGMAVVFVVDGRVSKIVHRGYRNTKTGRMELTAALTALRMLSKDQVAVIHCDSQYVVKTFTEGWINTWELEGWPCKNADLMKQLLAEYRKFRLGTVKFRHIKGHSGDKFNEIADHYASYKQFAEYEEDLPNGFGGEYVSNSFNFSKELYRTSVGIEDSGLDYNDLKE